MQRNINNLKERYNIVYLYVHFNSLVFKKYTYHKTIGIHICLEMVKNFQRLVCFMLYKK